MGNFSMWLFGRASFDLSRKLGLGGLSALN